MHSTRYHRLKWIFSSQWILDATVTVTVKDLLPMNVIVSLIMTGRLVCTSSQGGTS